MQSKMQGSDIVERLRAHKHAEVGGWLMGEAADEIERLRAENAQLRAGLNKYETAALQAALSQHPRPVVRVRRGSDDRRPNKVECKAPVAAGAKHP